MQVKLWGVRGSLASAPSNREYRLKLELVLRTAIQESLGDVEDIDDFIRGLPLHLGSFFGGNTTCASVLSAGGNLYIIDCGSGIRALGDELMGEEAGKGRAVIRVLLTHSHWDHLQGLPFFKPLYIPGNVVHFYAPFKDAETRLRRQQDGSLFFPATLDIMAARKEFHAFRTGEALELEEALAVDSHPLKHPGGSIAYRFRENGRSFVFASDAEFGGDYFETKASRTDFFMNADLLVLDSQYTLDESFKKIDWGHTSYTMAVNCAIRWKVRNLVLTHHEPSYDDFKLMQIYQSAVEHRDQMGSALPNIYLATEGMTFQLGKP